MLEIENEIKCKALTGKKKKCKHKAMLKGYCMTHYYIREVQKR